MRQHVRIDAGLANIPNKFSTQWAEAIYSVIKESIGKVYVDQVWACSLLSLQINWGQHVDDNINDPTTNKSAAEKCLTDLAMMLSSENIEHTSAEQVLQKSSFKSFEGFLKEMSL